MTSINSIPSELKQTKTTRDVLLAVGLAEFAERGYEATRLSDIVGQADLTTGAFYSHFKGKAHFFQLLLESYGEDLQSGLAGAADLSQKFAAWIEISRIHRGVIRSRLDVARIDENVSQLSRRLRYTCGDIIAPHLHPHLSGPEARRTALVLVDVLDHYSWTEVIGWTVLRPPELIASELDRLVDRGLYR